MYLVYKHTSPSGKSYIGITNDYTRRCRLHQTTNSCKRFAVAIRKYGWDNFLHEILYDELTLHQANDREQQAITEYGSVAPYGYNLTTGGRVRVPEAATRAKMSAVHKGKTISVSQKALLVISGKNPINVKKRHDAQKLTLKWFKLTSPTGEEYTIQGLRSFCLLHALDTSACVKVAKGKYTHHHGWVCRYND